MMAPRQLTEEEHRNVESTCGIIDLFMSKHSELERMAVVALLIANCFRRTDDPVRWVALVDATMEHVREELAKLEKPA